MRMWLVWMVQCRPSVLSVYLGFDITLRSYVYDIQRFTGFDYMPNMG